MKPWGAALVDPVPMRTTQAHAAIRYLRDADMSRCKKTGRDRLSPIPPRFKHQTLRERQLICSTTMGSGKQLACAWVDCQARSGDDWQTRCRERPAVGRIRARKLDHAKVSCRVQVLAGVVGDTIDRLIADRRSRALQVRPRRAASARI